MTVTSVRYLSQNVALKQALEANKVTDASTTGTKPRVIVLGTGWASLAFLGKVNHSKFDITVVSPRPHFTFNPLLPSVVGGALKADSAKHDLSVIHPNVHFITDAALSINSNDKEVITEGGRSLTYDTLVYAVGTTNNTFGIPGVEEHSFFLKELEDAKLFQAHVFSILDHCLANHTTMTPLALKEQLHFTIVGAGPTGTETAAEMVDLIHGKYAVLKPYAKISLIDMMPRILPMYSEKTSKIGSDTLKRSGNVEILLGAAMTKRTKDSICILTKELLPPSLEPLVSAMAHRESHNGGEYEYTLKTNTVLWASGVTQRPITRQLIVEQQDDKEQRPPPGILVDEGLKAKKFNDIYVLGDNAIISPNNLSTRAEEVMALAKEMGTSTVESVLSRCVDVFPQIPSGRLTSQTPIDDVAAVQDFLKTFDQSFRSPPPTAQNANQQGEYLAKVFNAEGPTVDNKHAYRFQNKGSMCYIGLDRAVIEIDKDVTKGLYGSVGTGYIWKAIYSSMQKTYVKKLQVTCDFLTRRVKRVFRLL